MSNEQPIGKGGKEGFMKDLSKMLQGFIKGTLFTTFVRKNSKFLAFLFLLIIAYIMNKYGAEREITRINRIKTHIMDLRYELQTIDATLVERNRQTVVFEKLQQKGIDLHPSKTPPIELKK